MSASLNSCQDSISQSQNQQPTAADPGLPVVPGSGDQKTEKVEGQAGECDRVEAVEDIELDDIEIIESKVFA